jgi:hypothetical protein
VAGVAARRSGPPLHQRMPTKSFCCCAPCTLQVTPFRLRKLLREQESRKKLSMYSQGRPTQQQPKLTYAELRGLAKLFADEGGRDASAALGVLPGEAVEDPRFNAPYAVSALLTNMCRTHELNHELDGLLCCPPGFAELFYSLASDHNSDTSVIRSLAAYEALLRLTQQGMLHRLPAAAAADVAVIKRDAAPVYSMLLCQQEPMQQDPNMLDITTCLVKCILRLWHDVIASRSPASSMSQPIPDIALQPPAMREVLEAQQQLAHYPELPMQYTRPQYPGFEAPDGRSNSQYQGDYRKCDNTKPMVGSGQRKFSPGLFKVTCVHGIVYGFHFLKDHESPNDLFTLLLTRFGRDKLPALLYYDNACKL